MSVTHHQPNYQTFELLVGATTPTGYPLTVTQSPAGEVTVHSHLDPTDDELLDALNALQNRNVDAAFLSQLGSFLFDELFVGEIGVLYRTSLGMVRGQGHRLRVRLRIEPPELARLPWEFLYDTQEEQSLAISTEIALVRYVPMRLPVRPSAVTLPLRLLVVLASPVDMPGLNTAQERRHIEEALRERVARQEVALEFLETATVANLQQALRSFQPHVFHFVGHGVFDGNSAQLVLEDEEGKAEPIDERTFRELFAGSSETRVAVLNACQTGNLSSTQPLVGLAPRLLQRQLSAVVAMQYAITDQAGLIFAREFYRSLAIGLPVDAAIDEARRGIWLELGADQPDWGAPVLFLRAADGQLFAVDRTARAPLTVPLPPQPNPVPAVSGFIGRAEELAFYGEQLQSTGMAIIAGMPGMGKSTLAAQLATQIGTPAKIFWHTFHAEEGVDSLIWKLAGFFYWNEQPALWQMLQGILQAGGQLPPINVLIDYLLQMVSDQGYLLCLDDFYFIEQDPALKEIIERMRAALNQHKLMLIITTRRIPDFVSLVDFKALTGLKRQDTEQLLAARGLTLDEELVEALYTYTEGNAELLTIALHTLARAADPKRLVTRLVDADDIERYLLKELDNTLTILERAIEATVALLGQASVRQLIECTLAQGDLRRHLHDLSERFLLTVYANDWQRKYDQHAILRAFYRELADSQQAPAMHRRAAAYYIEEETNWLAAAQHYLRAGDMVEAAEVATQHLWEILNQGQAHPLRKVLERLSAPTLSPKLWVEVLLARGQIYKLLGEHELARESFMTAYQLTGEWTNAALAHEPRARACQGLGELLQYSLPQEALAWLQRGLEEVAAGQVDATPLANALSQQNALLRVLMGGVYEALGDYDQAQRTIEEALALLPDKLVKVRANALLNLSNVYSAQGAREQAKAATLAALEISRYLHDHFLTLKLLGNVGIDKELAGDWTGALADYKQVLTLAQEQGNVEVQAGIKNTLGILLTKLGEDQAAHIMLLEAISLARQHQLTQYLIYALTSLAELLIQLKEWQGLEQILREAEKLALSTNFNYPLVPIYYSWAQYFLAKQERETALIHAEHAVQLAQELNLTDMEAVALRVLGQVQGNTRQMKRAEQSFTRSLTLLDGGDPYEIARTHVAWGDLLILNGEPERGKQQLQLAQNDFTTLGAQRNLAKIETFLAQ